MTVLTVRTIPDDVLRKVCDPVTRFDDSLRTFTDDMFETMYAAPGRGLAAPQVGVSQRIFVMDPTWKSGTFAPQAFINPEVVSASEETAALKEGCLSIPDVLTRVTRPARVTLRWFDLEGQARTGTFEGFAAACVQHEIDHLDGVLCTDYTQ